MGFLVAIQRSWRECSILYSLFVITTLAYGSMLLTAEGVLALARFRVKAQRV